MAAAVQGDSLQAVAYALFAEIARAEGKELVGLSKTGEKPDRKWILETYTECLKAVGGSYRTQP